MELDFKSPTPELVTAAGAALPAVCTVAVALRLWAGGKPVKHRHVDDWLTVPALLLLWSQGICLIVGVAKHALGYPYPRGANEFTISTPETTLARQLLYAGILIQIPCITLVKLSFIFFYRRVFIPESLRPCKFDYFLKGVAALLVAWAVAFFLAELFICGIHFEDEWISKNSVEQSKECVKLQPFDLAFTILDFSFDFLILVIPIRPLFDIKLSTSQKIGLCGVFSLGGLAIAASLTRFVVFTDQYSITVTIAVYWTCMESALALLAACLPPVFGLLNNMRRKRKNNHVSSFMAGLISSRGVSRGSNHQMRERALSDAAVSLAESGAWPGRQNSLHTMRSMGALNDVNGLGSLAELREDQTRVPRTFEVVRDPR